jgi:hypothetical protein
MNLYTAVRSARRWFEIRWIPRIQASLTDHHQGSYSSHHPIIVAQILQIQNGGEYSQYTIKQ